MDSDESSSALSEDEEDEEDEEKEEDAPPSSMEETHWETKQNVSCLPVRYVSTLRSVLGLET